MTGVLMTTFRNARPQVGLYPAYISADISNVPDGDIVVCLRARLDTLAGFYGGLTEAQAGHRYAPGKWSIREILGHVMDTERIFGYRALRIARGDVTPMPGFDENKYVAAAAHDARSLMNLVDEYRHVRQATVALFDNFDAAAWSRQGVANGYPVSVTALAWMICAHEGHHYSTVKERYL